MTEPESKKTKDTKAEKPLGKHAARVADKRALSGVGVAAVGA